MRRWAIMLLALALAPGACRNRPSFDERYQDTANTIDERARTLDAELNQAEADNAAR